MNSLNLQQNHQNKNPLKYVSLGIFFHSLMCAYWSIFTNPDWKLDELFSVLLFFLFLLICSISQIASSFETSMQLISKNLSKSSKFTKDRWWKSNLWNNASRSYPRALDSAILASLRFFSFTASTANKSASFLYVLLLTFIQFLKKILFLLILLSELFLFEC